MSVSQRLKLLPFSLKLLPFFLKLLPFFLSFPSHPQTPSSRPKSHRLIAQPQLAVSVRYTQPHATARSSLAGRHHLSPLRPLQRVHHRRAAVAAHRARPRRRPHRPSATGSPAAQLHQLPCHPAGGLRPRTPHLGVDLRLHRSSVPGRRLAAHGRCRRRQRHAPGTDAARRHVRRAALLQHHGRHDAQPRRRARHRRRQRLAQRRQPRRHRPRRNHRHPHRAAPRPPPRRRRPHRRNLRPLPPSPHHGPRAAHPPRRQRNPAPPLPRHLGRQQDPRRHRRNPDLHHAIGNLRRAKPLQRPRSRLPCQ